MKFSGFLLWAAGFGCAIAASASAAVTVTTFAGAARVSSEVDGTGAQAHFSAPYGIAVSASGDIYVVDHGGGVIRHVTGGGSVSTLAARFLSPYGITTDAAGNLYVTDTLNFVVDRVAPDGSVSVFAGTLGSRGTVDGAAGAQFSGPTGIASDASGNLYVADTNRDSGGSVLRRISASGGVTTLATGFVDARGVAVDRSGVIFVADSGDNTIRKVTADGTVTLYAGIPARTGADDGAATSARFNLPTALAVDGQGNVFVADFGNSVIREISSGTVSTVAGLAVVVGSADGSGTDARFYSPAGIAVDAGGTLFISDTGNDTIRLALAAGSPPSLPSSSPAAAPGGGASLINLSVRANVSQGAGNLVVGFVTSGGGTKHLLVRGIGPALSSFGIANPLARPELTVYSGNSPLAANAGWDGSPQLVQAMAQVGAFALATGSADTALAESLSDGLYTAQIDGAAGSTGVALAEIYDQDGAGSASHLINVSSRAQVGAGDAGSLVAGFVIGGAGSERVLIRGIGPALAPFGIVGALSSPKLTVFDSHGNTVATQTGWGGDANVAAVSAQVGAFGLANGSADCAIVLNLPAGLYSAQVTGTNGANGIALIEVYAAN